MISFKPPRLYPRRQIFEDGRRDAFIVWRGNLRAIFPVYFVSVVFLRIVRGGDHHTRRAF